MRKKKKKIEGKEAKEKGRTKERNKGEEKMTKREEEEEKLGGTLEEKGWDNRWRG